MIQRLYRPNPSEGRTSQKFKFSWRSRSSGRKSSKKNLQLVLPAIKIQRTTITETFSMDKLYTTYPTG